jgi:hypothetical protein
VTIAALLSAAAVVRGRPIAAGVAALVAMLAKEEAVMLPFILSGWAWLLARQREHPSAVMATWPVFARGGGVAVPAWIALAIYFVLRTQTMAMTPMTAPDAYRFVLAPGALVGNALEYLDRACTFSAVVVIVAHLMAWRRPVMTPAIRRVLPLAAIWFAGTFALTILVPNRSSLYALLPSVAPALVAGFLLQSLSDATAPMVRRRMAVAAVVLPLLLLPVYWSRNQRWVEIAELSSETFAAIQTVVGERPETDRLVFHDDPGTRRSFANTYDQLLPEAVRLASGRDIRVEYAQTGGTLSGLGPGAATRIVLENGRIRVDWPHF